MKFKIWIRKLVAAMVQGGAHAGSAWLGLAAAHSAGLSVPNMDLRSLAIIVATSGLCSFFKFLDTNPIPDDEESVQLKDGLQQTEDKAKLPLILVGCLILLPGCATTGPDLRLITDGTQVASGIVLQFAVKDSGTRTEIANQMYSVAFVIRSLSGGEAPTPEAFKDALTSTLPKYSHWADLAASLSSIYAGRYQDIKGSAKDALDVLEAIALGVQRGAEQISPK